MEGSPKKKGRVLQKGLGWSVNSGESVDFLRDRGSGLEPLCVRFLDLFQQWSSNLAGPVSN